MNCPSLHRASTNLNILDSKFAIHYLNNQKPHKVTFRPRYKTWRHNYDDFFELSKIELFLVFVTIIVIFILLDWIRIQMCYVMDNVMCQYSCSCSVPNDFT